MLKARRTLRGVWYDEQLNKEYERALEETGKGAYKRQRVEMQIAIPWEGCPPHNDEDVKMCNATAAMFKDMLEIEHLT
ncbi:hypothetical protein C8Q78DRAFT_1073614 [Trametes maxima]|nr:hypothetical protein C8Q78DRAFT_1073614 [Trametes maxima]